MILYDLVAEYNNFSVDSVINNGLITFSLSFKNKTEAKKMKSIIDLREISAYGHNYIIISDLLDKVLNIQLKDRVSG